jgi:hypothetical protein
VIKNAIKKHGFNNFEVLVLDYADNQTELNYLERMYAALYNSYAPYGYNLKECGGNSGKSHQSTIGKKAKTYEFINLETLKLIKIKNLRKFSDENGLDYRHMYQVHNGKRTSHQGYINIKSDINKHIFEIYNIDTKETILLKKPFSKEIFNKLFQKTGWSDAGISLLINGKIKTYYNWMLKSNTDYCPSEL